MDSVLDSRGRNTLMANNSTAYFLWFFSTFGLCGMHRFYLGKPISGVLYFLTFGLLGMGQVVDLFLIPEMVNHKNRLLYGSSTDPMQPAIVRDVGISHAQAAPPLDVQILKTCRDQAGATLSDCVIATEKSPEAVKSAVQKLCLAELLVVDNRESDGAVIYKAV